jgi:N-acetyl-anhydromuramyl-L-alanine amidase AmpD
MTKHRSVLQRELTNWLDEDVMRFIVRRHEHDGQTYRQIAAELSKSGYDVRAETVGAWAAAHRRETEELRAERYIT